MQLLKDLNDAQLQAATSESSHICCLAGAGSGKTRVLTTRMAYLNHNRVGTSNMLALTFTRLAAKEMKERLMKMIGEEQTKKLFCGTFHSFCVKVIREWGHLVGVDPNFTIYDEEDRHSIIDMIISELGCKKVKAATVLTHLQIWDKALPEGDLGRVMAEYLYRLRQNNALDLDLLLHKCVDILLHEQARDHYRNIYRYVFVDEYQDTSNPQDTIIKLLDPEHLFVVGDDFQAIYGWRGANVQNILLFNSSIKYPQAEVVKLETNYRSTRPIIKAANQLIAYNKDQTEKTLQALKDGPQIDCWECDNEQDEAKKVAESIMSIKGNDNYSDFAVLARTNKQLEQVKAALEELKIPVQVVNNGGDIFKKPVIKSVIRFIEAAHNPLDNRNIKLSFNFPEPRANFIQIEQFDLEALDNDLPIMDVLEHSDHPGAKEFSGMISEIRHGLETDWYDAEHVFKNACRVIGLEDYCNSKGLQNRLEDIEQAWVQIFRWQAVQHKLGEDEGYATFIKWLRTKDIQERMVQEETDAVKLLTVHAAKGLEFKTVYIIGMNQGVFPSKRTADMEEERRLMYVAITRAKERLIVSRALERIIWDTKSEETIPSQFLYESIA